MLPQELIASKEERQIMACGFVRGVFAAEGYLGIDALDLTSWPDQAVGVLYACLPNSPETWDRIEGLSPEASRIYWRRIYPFLFDLSDEDYARGINLLIDNERPDAAIQNLGHERKERVRSPSAQMLRALSRARECASQDSECAGRLAALGYEIRQILTKLQEDPEVQREDLASLEVYFITAFDGGDSRPRALEAVISDSPSLFVDLLTRMYRGENEEVKEIPESESERRRLAAENAYRILKAIRVVPGAVAGGIDQGNLEGWIQESRRLADACDRLAICDQHIGQLLSAGWNKDGPPFVPSEICAVIESVGSRDMDIGFEIAIKNSRGAFFRNPIGGGEQERELAAVYREARDSLVDQFPRMGQILETVASSYERQGRYEDESDYFE